MFPVLLLKQFAISNSVSTISICEGEVLLCGIFWGLLAFLGFYGITGCSLEGYHTSVVALAMHHSLRVYTKREDWGVCIYLELKVQNSSCVRA